MSATVAQAALPSRAWVEHAIATLIDWLDEIDAPATELEDGGEAEPEVAA